MVIMHKESNAMEETIKSKKMALAGGMKYHINYNIYHSVHNEFASGSSTFAKLLWESDAF